MSVVQESPSQSFTLPWVTTIYITQITTILIRSNLGWIVSMVESRGSRPLDYHRILATYAKWCHTVWRDAFPGTCVPTTASIKVVTPISRNGSVPDHRRSFWVSTSLPHANLKEQARLVREQYMHDVFGRLPDAPIFAEALKEGVDCGRVKWGHCAETLTTMWCVCSVLICCCYFQRL